MSFVPGSSSGKISRRLRAQLEATPPDQPVEVLIGLAPPDTSVGRTPAEKIAAIKRDFQRHAESVGHGLASAGGEVLDSAWINSTIRARIPAGQVSELEADDLVEALDTPERLEPDAG